MTDEIRPVPDDEDDMDDLDDLDDLDDMERMYDDMDNVELITMYLNGRLDPERAEAVRKRLEEDAAFRDFAEPLLIAWSIPPRHERKPRPAGETERAWEEFVKRTGWPNRPAGEQPPPPPPPPPSPPPRRPWFRHLPWLALVILGIAAVAFFRPFGSRGAGGTSGTVPTSDPGSGVVPYDTGWIAIGERIDVRLTPDASLRLVSEPLRGMRHVVLDGSARFRVSALDTASTSPRPDALVVSTRAGLVSAGESELTVTARADTTDVQVHENSRPRPPKFRQMMVDAAVMFDTAGTPLSRQGTVYHVSLGDLRRTRIVRGVVPVPFTKKP